METYITILGVFCDHPERKFQIREIARILKINHTTVRQYLNKLKKQGLITSVRNGIYPAFKADINRIFLNFKLYYNLEKLRKSGVIEFIEREYDYPTIVLFGSYAQARDISTSDIDLCLLTEVRAEADFSAMEKMLRRKVSIHSFNSNEWKAAKNKNPELVNNICNGIVLSGKLVVI